MSPNSTRFLASIEWQAAWERMRAAVEPVTGILAREAAEIVLAAPGAHSVRLRPESVLTCLPS